MEVPVRECSFSGMGRMEPWTRTVCAAFRTRPGRDRTSPPWVYRGVLYIPCVVRV